MNQAPHRASRLCLSIGRAVCCAGALCLLLAAPYPLLAAPPPDFTPRLANRLSTSLETHARLHALTELAPFLDQAGNLTRGAKDLFAQLHQAIDPRDLQILTLILQVDTDLGDLLKVLKDAEQAARCVSALSDAANNAHSLLALWALDLATPSAAPQDPRAWRDAIEPLMEALQRTRDTCTPFIPWLSEAQQSFDALLGEMGGLLSVLTSQLLALDPALAQALPLDLDLRQLTHSMQTIPTLLANVDGDLDLLATIAQELRQLEAQQLFQLAQTYHLRGEVQTAARIWQRLGEDFPDTLWARAAIDPIALPQAKPANADDLAQTQTSWSTPLLFAVATIALACAIGLLFLIHRRRQH